MSPHLEYTAKEYRLVEWVDKVDERKRRYFIGIDGFKGLYAEVAERRPDDDKVVRFLVDTLEGDKTFTGHLMGWKNAARLSEKEFWTSVCEAAATIILESYLQACAENRWPER